MDLKSGSNFWLAQNPRFPSFPGLKRDLRCEVAVIGGGLTGALIGYSLAQAGFDVVLLDKRNIARGSTSASTALILYEIDTSLIELARMIGTKRAVRAYQLCRDAIFQIEDVVEQLGNDCGFEKSRSLYLASRKSDVGNLKKEFQARLKAGFTVEWLTATDLKTRFEIHAPAALLSHDAAQIDPYRFTHRLVEASVARGMRAFGETEVERLENSSRKLRIGTKQGQYIMAERIIIAAGYESPLPLKRQLVQLKSTYAAATARIRLSSIHQQLLIWETARPYIYFRSTADSRLLIGGGDEDFHDPQRRDRLIARKTQFLHRRLKGLLPDTPIGKFEYAWTGTFGETREGLPYIGTERGRARIFHAYCYGANGTNFAMIAANLALDWIRGRRNRDAVIFSLNRPGFSRGPLRRARR